MYYTDDEIRAMIIAEKKKARSRENDKEAFCAIAFGLLLPMLAVFGYVFM